MKLSILLALRQVLLRQARLANLAFAYRTLNELGGRIARARLSGRVCLKPADAQAERYWASLTALEGNQSVLEEHFTDQDIMDLADVVAFTNRGDGTEFTFRIEALREVVLEPIRVELERAGVEIDRTAQPVEGRNQP